MTALSQATFLGRGACKTANPDLFADDYGGSARDETVKAAKKVCGGCEVRTDCLRWALRSGEPGIWGGTTARERRDLKVGRRPPPRPAPPPAPPTPENGDTMWTAEKVTQALMGGATVKETAAEADWPRQRVTALINGKRGWLLDARTDTITIGAGPAPAAQPEPAPEPALGNSMDAHDEPAEPVDELIAAARATGITHLTRAAHKAETAVAALREVYGAHVERERADQERAEKRQAAKDKAARFKAELEATLAELKELGGKAPKPKAAASSPGTPKQVRAWARENGVDCPQFGRVPQAVADQYSAAHGGGDG